MPFTPAWPVLVRKSRMNSHAFRILRAVKNRYGSTNELGLFRMGAAGLEAVAVVPSTACVVRLLVVSPLTNPL